MILQENLKSANRTGLKGLLYGDILSPLFIILLNLYYQNRIEIFIIYHQYLELIMPLNKSSPLFTVFIFIEYFFTAKVLGLVLLYRELFSFFF